jgi:hypothetical protein
VFSAVLPKSAKRTFFRPDFRFDLLIEFPYEVFVPIG